MACVRVLVPFLDEEDNRLRGIGSAVECPDARAEKLVTAGLAEPCEEAAVVRKGAASPTPPTVAPEEKAKKGAPAATGGETRAQLVERAETLGVAVPPKANKNKIAALIAEACGGKE